MVHEVSISEIMRLNDTVAIEVQAVKGFKALDFTFIDAEEI